VQNRQEQVHHDQINSAQAAFFFFFFFITSINSIVCISFHNIRPLALDTHFSAHHHLFHQYCLLNDTMGVHIFAPHSQTSKDPEATTHHDRRHLFRQLAELAFHLLHLISAIVVLAISVYFIYEYRRGAVAAPFWAALVRPILLQPTCLVSYIN
jgi:hypothetical protein